MKKLILLVCLFFMVSCTPTYANEEDNVIERSKKLSDLYVRFDNRIQDLNKSIKIGIDKKDDIQNRIQSLDETVQTISSSIPLYMKLYQMDKEVVFIDMYSQYFSLSQRYKNMMKHLEEKLDRENQKYKKYDIFRKGIEEYQQQLFNQFMTVETTNDGKYNPDSTISGMKDLPTFGGYYTSAKEGSMACLANGQYSIDSYSSSWILPVISGSISAGTWAYPNGSIHLGLDMACSMYSNIYAPANGIILYADAPVESNCGYLGNWCGWPAGGGNTICMICAVNGQLYGVTFAHLSNQIYVRAGQQVAQGEVIALSGNSGNSSGPHCHIEVFTLQQSLETVVSNFIQNADFSFGNGFSQAATCSMYACRIRPETIWR